MFDSSANIFINYKEMTQKPYCSLRAVSLATKSTILMPIISSKSANCRACKKEAGSNKMHNEAITRFYNSLDFSIAPRYILAELNAPIKNMRKQRIIKFTAR
jgi:hypothetical protein